MTKGVEEGEEGGLGGFFGVRRGLIDEKAGGGGLARVGGVMKTPYYCSNEVVNGCAVGGLFSFFFVLVRVEGEGGGGGVRKRWVMGLW